MKKVLIMLIFTLIFSQQIIAGIKITTSVSTYSTMTKKKKTINQTSYLSNSLIRTVMCKGLVSIYNTANNKMYLLFPKKQQYSVVNWDIIRPLLKTSLSALKNMKVKITVLPGKRRVNRWYTKAFKLKVKTMMNEMDVTLYKYPRFKTPLVWKKYMNKLEQLGCLMCVLQKKLKKYPGFPVKTVVSMKLYKQTIITTSLIKSINYRNIPNSLFRVPGNFKKIPFDLKQFNMKGCNG